MIALQLAISVAVALGLMLAVYSLRARASRSIGLIGAFGFVATLLFTILVGAGPSVPRSRSVAQLGVYGVCHIVSARRTEPASCGPKGLSDQPTVATRSAILLDGGGRLPIVPGRIQSNIDQSVGGGNGFAPLANIVGWAASVSDRRPADAVLVFTPSGHFIGAAGLTKPRPDVAQAFHAPALETSGFSLQFPLKLDGFAKRFRLFALANGIATPILLHCRGLNRQLGC